MQSTRVVPSAKTLLAYGITEWTGAIRHLAAMREAGVFVPAQTTQTLVAERRMLLWRWEDAMGRLRSIGATVTEEIIAEALAHLTEHQSEIDLIEKKLEAQP